MNSEGVEPRGLSHNAVRQTPTRGTLRDVAMQVGVSIKTASRVLNEHPNVAPETRTAVLAAMADLGYLPDPAARSLRAGTDNSVGVLVDSIGDVFFAELAAAIEEGLDAHGYRSLIVSSNRDLDREQETVRMVLQRRCAGMIVAPLKRDSLSSLDLQGAPVVFVDRVGDAPGAQSVLVDDVALARQATEHLISHGHTRIAMISDHRDWMETTRNRHVGYREAMQLHGIPVDENLICDDVPEASHVVSALKHLLALSEPPTAILSTNTRLSLGLLPALHQYGRTDIALISYGDFAMADSLSPAVTVIDHSATAVGMAAVDALVRQLGTDSGPTAEQVVYVPTELIARGSGELRPRN